MLYDYAHTKSGHNVAVVIQTSALCWMFTTQVMGINLLRRALLYFHARGDVLEVGAGTGRCGRWRLHFCWIGCLQQTILASHDYIFVQWRGTGRNLGYYPDKSTVNKVILTDSSEKMLERAKEKLSSMSENDRRRYEVMAANAANLHTFADNSFDTVLDTFGLCSFDDPVAGQYCCNFISFVSLTTQLSFIFIHSRCWYYSAERASACM